MSEANGRAGADSVPAITVTAAPAPGRPGRFIAVARTPTSELFRDTLDLNSAIARKRFVGGTMKAAFHGRPPDDWPIEERDRLETTVAALAAVPPGSDAPLPEAPADDPRTAALADTPPDTRAAAEEFLNDPKLVERVARDIQAAGVVGEGVLALALYLTGVSTQLREPLALVVRGTSSSGKSFAVETVSGLFPPEVVLKATDMSANALYYFPPGTLRHRWVVAGERSRIEDDDQAEATRALREMISAGRLSKAVPVKEGDRIVTKLITQDGPIAFVETTTLESIFAEDANRCLIFTTDERDEQTRKILDATAARAAGLDRADTGRLREVHHAIQRLLPRAEVVVPFAPDVAALLPANRVEERRDLPKVIRLVQAAALLRHRHRSRDEAGRIVAGPADYQLAARLAGPSIGLARSGLSNSARQCFEILKSQFAHERFDSNKAESAVKRSRSSVRAWLGALAKAGVLRQAEPQKGPNPAVWELTGDSPAEAANYLPPLDKVMERHAARDRGRLDA